MTEETKEDSSVFTFATSSGGGRQNKPGVLFHTGSHVPTGKARTATTKFARRWRSEDVSAAAAGNDKKCSKFKLPRSLQPTVGVRARLWSMLDRAEKTDLVFAVSGHSTRIEEPVHSVVIYGTSAVLDKLMDDALLQNNKGQLVVELNVASAETLRMMLVFFYTDMCVPKRTVDLIPLLRAAIDYKIVHLESACRRQLSEMVDKSNVCMLVETDEFKGEQRTQLLMYICTHIVDCLEQPTFRMLRVEHLLFIVESEQLTCNEVDLFKAVVGWAKFKMTAVPKGAETDDDKASSKRVKSGGTEKKMHPEDTNDHNQAQALRAILEPVLKHIRFPTMTTQEIVEQVMPTQLLTQEEMLQIFIWRGLTDGGVVPNREAKQACQRLFPTEPRTAQFSKPDCRHHFSPTQSVDYTDTTEADTAATAPASNGDTSD